MKTNTYIGSVLVAAVLAAGSRLFAAEAPEAEPKSPREFFNSGTKALAEKKYADARASLESLVQARPDWPEAAYNLACCLALDAKPEDAVRALNKAVDAGWWDRFHAEDDDDFVSLKSRAEFKETLERMKPPALASPSNTVT